jgi:hypothetical protein
VARFVARRQELAILVAALERGLAGDGGLVLVTGEAGIGKTTLVDRLAAEARQRSVRVVRGDADDWDRAPFGLFRGPRRALGLEGGDGGGGAGLPASERRWEELEQLADALGAHGPTLVVLEDLHWADELSLWVLERLPRALSGRPVAVVATAREDAGGAVLGAGAELVALRPAQVVALRGFEEDAVRELLHHLGAPAAEVDVAELVARTGGNPLFVREIVRLPDGVGLPPVVGEVLARSLARLGPGARRALAALATAGSGAPLGVVAGALGLATDALRRELDEAVAADVLVEAGGGPPRYRHALLAEAARAALAADEQRRLHQALAAAWGTAGAGVAGDVAAASTAWPPCRSSRHRAPPPAPWRRRASSPPATRPTPPSSSPRPTRPSPRARPTARGAPGCSSSWARPAMRPATSSPPRPRSRPRPSWRQGRTTPSCSPPPRPAPPGTCPSPPSTPHAGGASPAPPAACPPATTRGESPCWAGSPSSPWPTPRRSTSGAAWPTRRWPWPAASGSPS